MGIEPMPAQKTGWALQPTELRETRGELGHLLGWYVTRVLHTARISNVEIIKCVSSK